MKALEARLAATGRQMLHVTTDPPGADLSVDGAAAGKAPLDAAYPPGPHALGRRGAGHGGPPMREVVLLPPQQSLEVNLVLEPGQDPAAASALAAKPPAAPLGATLPDPAPRPVERKSWLGPIIAGSVGVVAAGAGIVMGLQARNAQNALLAGGQRPEPGRRARQQGAERRHGGQRALRGGGRRGAHRRRAGDRLLGDARRGHSPASPRSAPDLVSSPITTVA